MVLLLFFCSGATALVYEVVWSKYLSLMFGSTVQAQTVVLAAFMGGLALGNRIIGARADLLKRPLAVYGYLEIAIGLYAFFFTHFYHFSDEVFIKLGSPLLEKATRLLLLKGSLSALLLILPTILMGGTLPLLAAWLQKSTDDAGRRSARFYSVNSLGAVFGSLLAGFFLIQALGLRVTLQMTALVNVLIGFAAILLARQQETALSPAGAAPAPAISRWDPPTRALLRRCCLLVALTGAVSMGLEVLSSRCLALIFGASTQAFAIVLISFILGIGLGSAVVASPQFRKLQSEKSVFFLLIAAAAWLGLVIFNIEGLVNVYRHLKIGLATNSMGFRYHQLLTGLVSLLVLGFPAGLLGSTLPLCIRLLSTSTEMLGDRVGRLLTWNTLGAVIGVLLTGFVLMPRAGLRDSFAVLAGLLCLAALVLAGKKLHLSLVAVTLGGLLLLDARLGSEGWRHVLSSGIFRLRETEVNTSGFKVRREFVDIMFYKDAPDATVSVERYRLSDNALSLRINGKVDASSRVDLPTQYLLGHFPMLMRPDSKDVFVVGLGSGITAGTLLGYPVEHITVAENCEPVVQAARLFDAWNAGIVTNDRTRICREDARTVLKLSPKQYDVIVSQPSNPWMAGIGGVFSREFYQLAAARLKPGGLMVQWFQVYEMNDPIVFLVLRTFGTVFPHIEVWDAGSGDFVLIGSSEPFGLDESTCQRAMGFDLVRSQLSEINMLDYRSVLARQIASQHTASAIPGPGGIQTDDFPILEYEAPRAFYFGKKAQQLFEFDERTWQADLATEEKVKALSAITDEALRRTFTENTSVNPDLNTYVTLRLRNNDPGAMLDLKNRAMPCIFRPASAGPAPVSTRVSDDPVVKQLQEAEKLINSTNRVDGLKMMEAALRSDNVEGKPRSLFDDYAAFAAKSCLRAGDKAQALAFLELGLKKSPYAPQLNYLARILGRPANEAKPPEAKVD